MKEDDETGAKSYRYIKTGTNHFSLAFTYDWLACEDERRPHVPWVIDNIDEDDLPITHDSIRFFEAETGIPWSHRWRHREF